MPTGVEADPRAEPGARVGSARATREDRGDERRGSLGSGGVV